LVLSVPAVPRDLNWGKKEKGVGSIWGKKEKRLNQFRIGLYKRGKKRTEKASIPSNPTITKT